MANGKWKMGNVRSEFGRARRRLLFVFVLTFSIFHFPFAMPASAAPTQDDVFRSINENVGRSADGGKVLAILAAGAGLVILLVLFNRRQTRAAVPQPLNHQGKLLREIIKTAGLRPEQARQLKVLTEQCNAAGTHIESPVTLLLCPSLLRELREKKN
jgi:hypothetical protein